MAMEHKEIVYIAYISVQLCYKSLSSQVRNPYNRIIL